MTGSRSPRALVIHGWSDRNKGDAAILRCLADLIRGHSESIRVKLLSGFGPSDRRLEEEYFETKTLFPEILGSAFPILPVERKNGGGLGRAATEGPPAVPSVHGLLAALFYTVRAALAVSSPIVPGRASPLGLGRAWTKAERDTLTAMRRADIIISKGGGFIHAEPGLRSTLRLFRNLFPFIMARKFGVPFVLYGQSIGPFANAFQRDLVRRTLNHARAILTRESLSARVLGEMGVKAPVRVIPDLAFGLRPDARTAAALFGRHRIPGDTPLVGVTVRQWRLAPAYIDGMAAAIDRLVEEAGVHVVIWPQSTGPGAFEDDRLAGRQVRDASRHRDRLTLVEEEVSPPVLKAAYARMDLMLATRFHSAILAISEGVPTLVIDYWGAKARGIYGDLNLLKWVFSIEKLSSDDLTRGALELWNLRAAMRRRLRVLMPPLIEQARRLDPVVAGILTAAAAEAASGAFGASGKVGAFGASGKVGASGAFGASGKVGASGKSGEGDEEAW